jgi:hypothetical protein
MSVNLSSTTPAAPAGSTNVTFQTDGSGNVSAYISSAVELTGNGFDATAQTADIGTTSLITSPTAGRYRVSAYIIVTTVDGASSTLPSIVLTWNDADNGAAQTLALTPTNAGNTTTTYEYNDAFVSLDVSAPLAFSTTGYASGTPATMQFAIHITVEKL